MGLACEWLHCRDRGHLQPSSLSHWWRFLGELWVRQCFLLCKHPGDPKSPDCNKSPKLPSLKGFNKEATEVAIISSSRSIAFPSSLGILSPCQGLLMVGMLSRDVLLSHPHLATRLLCLSYAGEEARDNKMINRCWGLIFQVLCLGRPGSLCRWGWCHSCLFSRHQRGWWWEDLPSLLGSSMAGANLQLREILPL